MSRKDDLYEAIDHIEEALSILIAEQEDGQATRQLAIAITQLEHAQMRVGREVGALRWKKRRRKS
jgi:hypothetical protein